MERGGREPGYRAAAAPARALEGQEPGRDPPERSPVSAIPKLASLPGKGTGRAAALLLCTAASFLIFCLLGWAEVVSLQLGHLILFHPSREIASCYSPGVSRGKGEQNHLSRSIPLPSRAGLLLDFLLNGGSS